ncbi:MAG: thermonuclease family protein [Bacteroidia bacterium]
MNGKIFTIVLLILSSFSLNAKTEKVRYVFDGDTFLMEDGRKIRMLGIDTPELSFEEFYAEEAKNRLSELISGRRVELREDKFSADTDRYGRYLRYVHFMERDVNLQLIEEGYARVFDRYKIERLGAYLDAEAVAQEEGLGLWQKEAALAQGRELLFYGLGLALILFVAFWQTMRRIRRRP